MPSKKKALIELNGSTIEVLKDLNTSLLLLKQEGIKISEELKNHIDLSREHISNRISQLENKVEK